MIEMCKIVDKTNHIPVDEWDTEETMTVAELNEAITNRETYLATIKQRQDEYKASKGAAPSIAAPATGAFNF